MKKNFVLFALISDEVSLFVSDSKYWFLWFLRQYPYISADIPLIEDCLHAQVWIPLSMPIYPPIPWHYSLQIFSVCYTLRDSKQSVGVVQLSVLSSKRSFVFLQCYIIYTPAGFCPKYFLSGSGISILEVCPCHFKSLNIRLQTKYVDFCTKLKCLFTRYTLLLVRFLNFQFVILLVLFQFTFSLN